jgi:hypothetical protein
MQHGLCKAGGVALQHESDTQLCACLQPCARTWAASCRGTRCVPSFYSLLLHIAAAWPWTVCLLCAMNQLQHFSSMQRRHGRLWGEPRLFWPQNENKFMCPCHGSQYNAQGKVVRGPAPLVRTFSVFPPCCGACMQHAWLCPGRLTPCPSRGKWAYLHGQRIC